MVCTPRMTVMAPLWAVRRFSGLKPGLLWSLLGVMLILGLPLGLGYPVAAQEASAGRFLMVIGKVEIQRSGKTISVETAGNS